jgi:hypothetical protein
MGELMDQAVQIAGWTCIALIGAATLVSAAVPVLMFFKRPRHPQVAGATLPALGTGLNLSKRYDIVYGANYGVGATYERLCGARIVGYLPGDHDATSGEYADSRWLVVELADGRRGYLRPRSVLWIIESDAAQSGANL